jgi:hypothetical protein
MKAIVLTFDRYRTLAAHMIRRYAVVWPDHPFEFRIACQQPPPEGERLDRVDYRVCPEAIKATVLTLLEDLPDDEWIYWCVDDKYPIAFDLPDVRAATRWVTSAGAGRMGADGVLFCRCRHLLRERFLTPSRIFDQAGNFYRERLGYEQIWIHQFLRVKVLRHLFKCFPDDIPQAKLMDGWKKNLVKPSGHRLYVAEKNMAVFGESATRGKLTENCCQSLQREGMALPEWFDGQPAGSRVMGRFSAVRRLRLWIQPFKKSLC